MLRAIREVKPKWIVGENVNGLTTRKFRQVLEDIFSSLETEGYKTLPVVIPASAIGADQERERIWFIAHSESFGRIEVDEKQKNRLPNEHIESFESFRRHCSNLHLDMEPDWTRPGIGIGRNDDGLSEGVDRLKQLGNAIVPQVAFEIFKAIEKYESLTPFLIKEDKK